MDSFKDERVMMLFNDYKYIGIGIYMIILKELYSGKIKINSLNRIARENDIERHLLKNLVNDCCKKYTTKAKGSLLKNDARYIWSEELIMKLEKEEKIKATNRKNGSKGGRPRYTSVNNSTSPINITKEQEEKLKKRYGEPIITSAYKILEQYLKNNKKIKEKSHYWLFRKDGWLINTAQKELNDKKDSRIYIRN